MKRNLSPLFLCSMLVLINGSANLHAFAKDASASASKSSTAASNARSTKSNTTKRSAKTKQTSQITEDRAVAIVSARSEVRKFLQGVKDARREGVTAQVEFDRKEGADLVVHVYEFVPDDAESGHTATFNWYHVNSKTGKVTTEF